VARRHNTAFSHTVGTLFAKKTRLEPPSDSIGTLMAPADAAPISSGPLSAYRIGRSLWRSRMAVASSRRTLGYSPPRWPTWRRFDPSSSPSATEVPGRSLSRDKSFIKPNKTAFLPRRCCTRGTMVSRITAWRRRFSPKLRTLSIWYGSGSAGYEAYSAADSETVRIPLGQASLAVIVSGFEDGREPLFAI
jgi:hypothetical protein